MTSRKLGFAGGAGAVLLAAIAAGGASCAQTPPNQPIRSFEGARRAASVCLQVNDPQGYPLATPPQPVPIDECASVPSGVNGALFQNQLYVLVTQTVRGEVAVVDLSSGGIVDEDLSTPGTNFIPVGTNPTDIVVSPDSAFSYVGSGSTPAPAIYALDNSRILGTSVNWQVTTPSGSVERASPLTLPDLTACRLPDAPMALAAVSVPAGDAGSAGGTGTTYYLAAMLAGVTGPASVVMVDPVKSGLIGGTPGALPPCVIAATVTLSTQVSPTWTAGAAWPDGIVYADAGSLSDAEPGPGPACIMTPAGTIVADAGEASPASGPASSPADAESPDAGAEAPDAEPAPAPTTTPDAGPALPSDEDAEAEAGAAANPVYPSSVQSFSASSPQFMVMRTDIPILYVADKGIPVIHVIDVSNPVSPQELAPLLATSLADPGRQVPVSGIAISPPTRDYKIYLYAIDAHDGSLMVYDVTDPANSTHVPMTRPHAELDPLEPPDRITFSSPVAIVAFVQHDWPIPAVAVSGIVDNGDNEHTFSGFLCNPGTNAHPTANVFNDLGAWYRVDQVEQIQPTATATSIPSRLRGVFGLATLGNGNIVAIDVDDWDAPCRRPDPMTAQSVGGVPPRQTSALDLPEPQPTSSADLSPYHVPISYNFAPGAAPESPGVTLEPFFPVSAPNRVRSAALLRNDPSSGNHAPNLLSTPLLVDVNGDPIPSSTTNGLSPVLLPTTLPAGWIDWSLVENPVEPNPTNVAFTPVTGRLGSASSQPTPGVRFSYEDPTVMQNEDWSVTYEGVIPSTVGVEANFASTQAVGTSGAYSTLTLTVSAQNLCSLGVEDSAVGQARATQVTAAMDAASLPEPPGLASWTSDYVQIIDDVAPEGDPYWYTAPPGTTDTFVDDAGDNVDNCWAGTPLDEPSANYANLRYQTCFDTFGPATDANSYYARDFPILEAYADHLVIGRFAWPNGVTEATTNRTVQASSPSNAAQLKMAACCFHRQAAFSVRTGGEWLANGASGIGVLHHVVTDPSDNRCRLSCDPKQVLLNARSFDILYANPGAVGSTGGCAPPNLSGGVAPAVDRNSPLAMRNPMFSYVSWSGCANTSFAQAGKHSFTARDLSWHFSVRGGFTPLTMSLTGGANTSVNPQSMLFIDPLGQIAVVDGSLQGLVIFDLNSLAMTHAPFF